MNALVFRCCRILFLLAAPGLLSASLLAQVMQPRRFATELRQARALTAGATAGDIPHHIHYDVKFFDRSGHQSTATYDIYRDPLRYVRVDIAAVGFNSTHIKDLLGKREWRHFTGEMPLKIFDLREELLEPRPAIYGLEHPAPEHFSLVQSTHEEVIDGAPYQCADDGAAIRVCFDPFIQSFAFAQLYDQTVTYDNWQRIGTHGVPGTIRIYDGKKLLVEATGKAEVVKRFPAQFFLPGNEPSQSETGEHKLIHFRTVEESGMYGNAQIRIAVDAQGKVTRAEIIDSDDKKIESAALRFARGLRFAPETANAGPVSFSAVFYMHYFPPD